MSRVPVIIGLGVGFILAIAVAVQMPLVKSIVSDVEAALEYEADLGTPILSESDAIQRTLQGPWPPHVEPTFQTARLLAYGEFSEWAFGIEQQIEEPLVWAVAIEADDATQYDFGFDPSSDSVTGFWYAWKACSGEQLAFGGLAEGQATRLGELSNSDSNIVACSLREAPPNEPGPDPWD